MTLSADLPPNSAQDASIKGILAWLALAHDRTGSDDTGELLLQFAALREAAIPPAQRIKLLDLLYGQTERIVSVELPKLHEVSLPVSRKLRQRIRELLELLETLAQDYLNSLAELFDPEGNSTLRTPHTSLRRAMIAMAWQIRIYHLVAAPIRIGLWQQLHTTFKTAHRLGMENLPGPRGGPSIHRIYTGTLLAAIAQPASFSAAELAFISEYIDRGTQPVELTESPPTEGHGIFWVDLDKDFPAHALIRRTPSADSKVLYFSCDNQAAGALKHRAAIEQGTPSSALDLPDFAGSRGGRGVLKRLNPLWGHPTKRKFPRRRQSYRANLCSGLEHIWRISKDPNAQIEPSEWMVTNESPDGYALMHISGRTEHLRVGDIVAIQPSDEWIERTQPWHICIIRWAISENPEHVELGLQLIASRAIAAEIAHTAELISGNVSALLLPEAPPFRPAQSLVVPSGLLKEGIRRIILLVEKENLEIRELQAMSLEEQTGSIEVFSVAPDESQ